MGNEQSSSANKDQEPNMNERGDQVAEGPAQEEVNEVNQQKRPLRRPGFLGKIVNTGLALGMFGSVAALKAKAEENTVSQTPPQVEPSNNQEVQNTPPSAPGVKVEFPTADAPVTDAPVPDAPVEGPMNVVTTIHMPAMFKGAPRPGYQAQEVKEPETPLYLREFGAPERGVVMRNKVEQGGGNLAYVEMGDQELWNNLMYLRETYGRPDLKLEITYYSSLELYSRDPNRPNYNPENEQVLYWDVWAGNPGIYENGLQVFSYREADKTLEFRITLPETWPGKVPTEDSVNKMHRDFMYKMRSVFASNENYDGRFRFPVGSPEYFDFFRDRPVVVGAEPPNIFNVSRSGLWIKLE